jgi:hypothetical protein
MRDASRRTLPSLPGAKAEAEDVAHMLRTEVVNSREAVKTEVMRRMGQAAVIHFAAHGLSDERNGLLSALALAPASPDDGLLSAREVMGMRLSADLVVLSACNSGRGAVEGDSIYGLPRAFLTAGAHSVLSSLWKAADEPTRMLVKVFFKELLGGTEKAGALRRAMIATRGKYPAPANWAGFVLTGEPDLAGAAPSWMGSPASASTVSWRRSLFPVPIDAHLLTDNAEGVTFTIARNPQAVIDYYGAALAAAGYTEQVRERQTSGASFELSFARSSAEDLVRVIGLSVASALGGPAASAEPELMVTVDYKRVLPPATRPGTAPPTANPGDERR